MQIHKCVPKKITSKEGEKECAWKEITTNEWHQQVCFDITWKKKLISKRETPPRAHERGRPKGTRRCGEGCLHIEAVPGMQCTTEGIQVPYVWRRENQVLLRRVLEERAPGAWVRGILLSCDVWRGKGLIRYDKCIKTKYSSNRLIKMAFLYLFILFPPELSIEPPTKAAKNNKLKYISPINDGSEKQRRP